MLIDSHCHLDFDSLSGDLDGVIDRAKSANVGAMVTICTRVRQFARIKAIADRYQNVWCTVGTHPHNADEEDGISTTEIALLAKAPKVIGIGEAGLDYHYKRSEPQAQIRGFRTHIEVARETGLPLVIHARNADDDVGDILEEEMGKGAFNAVLHCFSSGERLAKRGLEMGLYISFSGIVTFNSAKDLQNIAKSIPSDRILVETDAPYLAPAPHRGKSNEPAYVAHTAQKVADLRGERFEDFAKQTTENFFELFSRADRGALIAGPA